MLFNSYRFIFVFFPIVVLVSIFLKNSKKKYIPTEAWLILCSLFFVASSSFKNVLILLASVLVNYFCSTKVRSCGEKKSYFYFLFGVAFNICYLGYFKYTNFILTAANDVFGMENKMMSIGLPLGISFYTFQQIAFLFDLRRGVVKEFCFRRFGFFVSFFPQLVAGPIVHYREIAPQIEEKLKKWEIDSFAFIKGISYFSMGLFKKVILADNIALYVAPVFDKAESTTLISFIEAWAGTFSYSLQLYFDFSGYSDMAIGLAQILGIYIPTNFFSPYKAINIQDFWRRWHITLSTWLRDYIYIPCGGNRAGFVKTQRNVFVTFLLGGLWHGASYNFVIWGVLHGIYTVISNLFGKMFENRDFYKKIKATLCYKFLTWFLTIYSVFMAWIFFRATSVSGALNILKGCHGFNGVLVEKGWKIGLFSDLLKNVQVADTSILSIKQVLIIISLFFIAVCFPNTEQIFTSFRENGKRGEISFEFTKWRPVAIWGLFLGCLFTMALMNMNKVSDFLYWNF